MIRKPARLPGVAAGALVLAGLLAVYRITPRAGDPASALSQAVPSQASASTPPAAPEFVGRAACAGCHAEQNRLWQGSHHYRAMQEANESTVLGNFADTLFRKDGVKSRFFRRNGGFWVNTDGPDGKPADFEIQYTFGFTPLQQYLVALPGGRLQALSIAWDSRPKAQGGQRWFHLYPNEKIGPDDELHWTRHSQNWNHMCAECHSTHLLKNYDPVSHGYRTTWSEIDVSCEACHGPGSRHVAWAGSKDGKDKMDGGTLGLVFRLDERRGVRWTIDPGTGNATRGQPRATAKEIETCARCHARRGQWFADDRYGQPLLATHLPALLREGLYHADGQIDGEVYEYGSFLQSRMHRAGVTCSDCHEPHSLRLRTEGNGVCLQCHAAGKYAGTNHHHHPEDSPGGRCVECHMPARTYMVVDRRRDHGFRIPRPDLSAKLETPNACANCHEKRPARWAADQLRRWYGHDPQGYQAYAEALSTARHGEVDAEAGLVALLQDQDQPAIARATAAMELGRWLSPDSLPSLLRALDHSDPLIRAGALRSLEPLPPEQRWQVAHRLLSDPVRVIRALAAEALADVPVDQASPEDQANLRQASEEYLVSLRLNADEPGTQVNLGNWNAAKGEADAAERAYREALKLDPGWVPAYVNLTDLYRQTDRDTEGEAVLREGLSHRHEAAALHHSLGLLEVRRHDLPAALASFKRALELAPGDLASRYVYAMALDNSGRRRDAEKVVKAGLKQAPGDRALGQLLSTWKAAGQHR